MNDSELLEQAREKAKEFLSLLAKTDHGNPMDKDVIELRNLLQENPVLWSHAGNLAKNAASNLINSVDATPALQESLKTGYRQLQVELGSENTSRVECLLIEQVVLAWMRLYIVEFKFNSTMNLLDSPKSCEYWEKRLNAAQRRFLRACTTLARIRKIGLPVMQINIADQQVNQVNS